MLTLNQIKEYLIQFFENHLMVNTVIYADDFDFAAHNDISYKVVNIQPVDPAQVNDKEILNKFKIVIGDMEDPNKISSEDDIYSDCLSIANDFISYFGNDDFEDFYIDKNISIQRFSEKQADRIAGVVFAFNVRQTRLNNPCTLPLINPFSGVSFTGDLTYTDRYFNLLTPYLTIASASTLFQPLGNYSTGATIDLTDYYTKEQSDAKYTGSTVNLSDYFTKEQSDSRYLTGATVDLSAYQLVGNYVSASTLNDYYTTGQTNNLFQPSGSYVSASTLSQYQLAGNYLTGITSSEVTNALGYIPLSGVTGNQLAGNYLTGITSAEVIGALGFTPLSAVTGNQVAGNYLTGITSSEITTALGYAPLSGITGYQLAGNYVSASTLSNYQLVGNYLTGITSSEITTALGYVPLSAYTVDLSGYQLKGSYVSASTLSGYQIAGNYVSASTLSGYQLAGNYLTGITSSEVTNALGFTPLSAITGYQVVGNYVSASTLSAYQLVGNYLTGITSSQVTTALGYTPLSGITGYQLAGNYVSASTLNNYYTTGQTNSLYQPIGSYLSGITSLQVTNALGYTPLSGITGYQVAGNYVSASTLNNYYTTGQTNSLYQPIGSYQPSGSYVSASTLSNYQLAGNYLTGITSSQVTGALGYTPLSGITLTTSGTTGASTLSNGYLNIPQYVGTGGSGTVTSVSGVTANGFTFAIANPSTTPVITLSLQNATSSQTGQLTSTDWNTFNNKIGLITTATLSNKRITQRIGTVVSSATPIPDSDNNDQYNVTALATGATFGIPLGTPTDGQPLLIRIKDSGTARTLAFNSIYRASTDFALPTTTVISKTMYIQFLFNIADTKWDCIGLTNGF